MSDSSNSISDELSEVDELFKNVPKITEKQITTKHSEIRKVRQNGKNLMI